MKPRSVLAAFFVVLCLLLCGLILRRQISAHPLPPDSGRREAEASGDGGGRFGGDFQDFRPASPAMAASARKTIAEQMTALSAGDGAAALAFQSAGLRHQFSDPAQFIAMIAVQYPEFRQSRHIDYGPVWADSDGDRVRARVTVEGRNGRHVRAIYQLVKEGGQLKVGGVRAMPGE